MAEGEGDFLRVGGGLLRSCRVSTARLATGERERLRPAGVRSRRRCSGFLGRSVRWLGSFLAPVSLKRLAAVMALGAVDAGTLASRMLGSGEVLVRFAGGASFGSGPRDSFWPFVGELFVSIEALGLAESFLFLDAGDIGSEGISGPFLLSFCASLLCLDSGDGPFWSIRSFVSELVNASLAGSYTVELRLSAIFTRTLRMAEGQVCSCTRSCKDTQRVRVWGIKRLSGFYVQNPEKRLFSRLQLGCGLSPILGRLCLGRNRWAL